MGLTQSRIGGKKDREKERQRGEPGPAARRIARKAADGFGEKQELLCGIKKKLSAHLACQHSEQGGGDGVGGDKRCAVPLT